MRVAALQFVAHPTDGEVSHFADGQKLSLQCLDNIEAALPSSQQSMIGLLHSTLENLKSRFDALVSEQRALGFNEGDGVTRELITASNWVESTIHDDLSWVAAVDAGKLLASLLPCAATKANTG